jgi:hypothetical protein
MGGVEPVRATDRPVSTALLLLAGDPGPLKAALGEADLSWAAERWAGVRADDDPLATTAYGARTPFNAVVDLEVEGQDADALAARLGRLLDGLGGAVDRDATAAVVGRTHRIIDGRTDVALAYAIHRVGSLTGEEYREHWLHRHGPLAKELVPTSGYEQTHAAADAVADASQLLGLGGERYDGVAMCFFGARQDFVDMLEAREGNLDMNRIYEDELRFLDHARSYGALVRRVTTR